MAIHAKRQMHSVTALFLKMCPHFKFRKWKKVFIFLNNFCFESPINALTVARDKW